MPYPGGDADKAGNRYEALWTIYCLLQILKGDVRSITLELLGDEWHGVEFKLETNGYTEYHQVKRQNSSDGRWTIADLASKSVLDTVKSILASDYSAKFKFISQDSVAYLPELHHRASSANSYDEFNRVALNATEHSGAFKTICKYWAESEELSYSYLRRFEFAFISENELRDFIKAIATTLIAGNEEAVISTMRVYCETHLHQALNSTLIWAYLREAGFSPIAWGQDNYVLLNIERRNKAYEEVGKTNLINNAIIPRKELVQSICSSLDNATKHIAILGDAGSGKKHCYAGSIFCLQKKRHTRFWLSA